MSDHTIGLLSAVVTATPEIAAFVDARGGIAWVNPAFVTRWSCAQTSTIDGLLDVVHPGDRAELIAAWDTVARGEVRTAVRHARLGCAEPYRSGRVRFTRVTSGDAIGSVVIHVEDVENAFRPAYGVDSLTGLADRDEILAQMDAAMAAGSDADLILLDLDGFGLVNDSLGRAAGDEVLMTIGRRLRESTHRDDVVARLNADEFAVLCDHDAASRASLVETLRTSIRTAIRIGDSEHVLDACVGTVSVDVVATSIDALAAAGIAVRMAKGRGPGRVEVFDSGHRDSALRTMRRTSELRQAAARGEFVLHYQPIVDLQSGTTIGCEALMRWNHPEEGLLGASEFMDLAETSGLVDDLTEAHLMAACSAAARFARTFRGEPPYVSINLSPRQLADPQLSAKFDRAFQRTGVPPARLVVEITETAMFVDLGAAIETLEALRARGVRVALDDFGTGYSSLLRLRELPVDCLKVDRAFVSGIARNPDDLAIVASVVHMATTLGLGCIAEGVESDEQVEELRKLGCGAGQGYLWSPAVPVDEVPRQPGVRPNVRTTRQGALSTDAATTSRIMQLHRAGASLHSIAAVLNQAGSRTSRGTRWHPSTVARVVSETAYPQLRDDWSTSETT